MLFWPAPRVTVQPPTLEYSKLWGKWLQGRRVLRRKALCPVRFVFQHGAGHAGLHGDGLVGPLKEMTLLKRRRNIQGYAALYGLHALVTLLPPP